MKITLIVVGVVVLILALFALNKASKTEICNEGCEVCDPKPTIEAEKIVVSAPKKAKKSKKTVK